MSVEAMEVQVPFGQFTNVVQDAGTLVMKLHCNEVVDGRIIRTSDGTEADEVVQPLAYKETTWSEVTRSDGETKNMPDDEQER